MKATEEKIYIKTFGCQMNEYDSGKILAHLAGRYQPVFRAEEADLVILNTCSIREKAEQKVRSFLGRLGSLKRSNPRLLVGVGGCVAQQEGRRILEYSPLVDFVFGTHNLDEVPALVEEREISGRRVCRVTPDRGTVPSASVPCARAAGPTAMVTIMKGCDNFCAYCVVPYVRGREASRPAGGILSECRKLLAQGVREITLLGQNVSSYRDPEGGGGFVELLEEVDALEGLMRLRFVTAHPRDFSPGLARTMASLPRVCEHVHLPVQSGSDRILSAMKRGYTRAQYTEKVALLRDLVPEVEITSDVIVGFPGEGRADFEATLSLIEEAGFLNAFSFRFSPRPGTEAAGLPDPVDPAARRSWLPELQERQNAVTARKMKGMLGRNVSILVEGRGRDGGRLLEGRTRNNYIVHFPGGMDLVGRTVQVRVTASRLVHLEGEWVP